MQGKSCHHSMNSVSQTHQLPQQTPSKHALIGKESHRNQQNLLGPYHTPGEEIEPNRTEQEPLDSVTAHCTAPHSQAVSGTLTTGLAGQQEEVEEVEGGGE